MFGEFPYVFDDEDTLSDKVIDDEEPATTEELEELTSDEKLCNLFLNDPELALFTLRLIKEQQQETEERLQELLEYMKGETP